MLKSDIEERRSQRQHVGSNRFSLTFAGKQVTIYLGTFTLVAGVVGGILITIVFLSLRTFRQSSCAFYLTIMSLFNIGQVVTGLLNRIMQTGFGIDWSVMSLFYCKLRYYLFEVCALTSMTCICLATIDQYLATSPYPRWQQWSNIKLAQRLLTIVVLIQMLYNVPYFIFVDHVVSVSTGKVNCLFTNVNFQRYNNFGNILVIGKLVPMCITFFFGFLAYRNVPQFSYRTLPLVRRKLDQQLTSMILMQVFVALFTIVPYCIVFILMMIPGVIPDAIGSAVLQLASTLTVCVFYMYFAVRIHSL